jgi:hypothetical protein
MQSMLLLLLVIKLKAMLRRKDAELATKDTQLSAGHLGD